LRGLHWYAFRKAIKAAELDAPGRLTLHSLRHTFASFLITSGLDVVFVGRPARPPPIPA
jgi:site-specific recombinase XerD